MQKKIKVLLLILVIVLAGFLSCPAWAEAESGVLTLPEQTAQIADYAFSGCAEITQVELPDGLLSIGAYAFDGCSLAEIRIPSSVVEIGEGAIPPGTEIICRDDSYAAEWAAENGFVRPKRYYALLIGQEYTGSNSKLPGCFRDVDAIEAMLEGSGAFDYIVTVGKDLTAAGILEAVDKAFRWAGKNDVCLFHYSGHGMYSADLEELGALYGSDWKRVTLGQLKSALDRTPASKIVVFDSCYSGNAIARSAEADVDMEAVNAAIIGKFSDVPRSGMAEDGYYVLTAAAKDEECYSKVAYVSGEKIYYGAFTGSLLYGSGYDEMRGRRLDDLYADKDGDGLISLAEGYNYTYARVLAAGSNQHAQCYPEGSGFPLWGREPDPSAPAEPT